ncbi:uncharacterized protein PHACADRAFT_210127 [Phanerochaete carnosa HHB-10118-sp]|uniref:Uncharacterized protein n=1 Tax=Phanerochaete carnosa (strain HHB-10118-sp) TaxID=650164 RepID=K5WV80_PHACS|nr:uncharacterized protein PHACADRAFT_210127 [Phanerochaete carnosa HHB-10118-sp]EKM54317.1 hypothetical protein PHACADRAFT_210127 [Phanerochaete carnosa HHB-10118-sp]
MITLVEMPKDSPKKSTPRSPTKSPRKLKQIAAATDESTWRASTIGAGTTINKSSALSLYRLKEQDLAGLRRETSQAVVIINGEKKPKPMFLYNERDVERQAWKKHGGPEAFESYLNKLKERFYAKPENRHKFFSAPSAYSTATVGIFSLPPAPKLLDPDDEWVVTPGLINIKPQFPRWLWRACNKKLDKIGDSEFNFEYHGLKKQQREKALRTALATLVPKYPPRPDSLLPSSPSVDKLRDVLSRTPKSSDDEDMESWEDGPTGDTDYYWSDRYLEQLFQALIDVIEEHGIEGWENVRWEYASCLDGLCYNDREDEWRDSAFAWLCGWLQHVPNALTTRRCGYSEIGRRYNNMLPRLAIGRGDSVKEARKKVLKKTPYSPPKSPRKARRTAAATDESTWRASRVRIHKKDCCFEAVQAEQDLASIPFEKAETITVINGQNVIKPMFLYNERAVERQAWRKHGGPEAFEAYLDKLKDRFHAKPKNAGGIFPAPDACSTDSVFLYSSPRTDKLLDPDDEWVVTPGPLRMKPRFPEWLWHVYNEALDKVGDEDFVFDLNRRRREEAMRGALITLVPKYPSRPDSLLPSSPSVDRLREVLYRAPKDNSKDMRSWMDGSTGDIIYYWSDRYTEQLFEALVDVIEEHDIEGWESARWEVYDKASVSLGCSFPRLADDIGVTVR